MKKILAILLTLVCFIAAQAATYRVTYDVNNQKKTSFTITVNSDRLAIAQKTYSLRQLGTITNSGVEFRSYMYGQHQGMFCVSTTPIKIDKDLFTCLSGYIVMIDNKAYLADKIN